MIGELGIDVDRYSEFTNGEVFRARGMRRGVFFDRETFGEDRLLVRERGASWADFLAQAPLSEAARRDLVRLHEDEVDYLPDLSLAQKRAYLRAVSYQDFLLEAAKVHPDAIPVLRTGSYWAIGIDALSAWAAVYSGYPGTSGLGFSNEGPEARPFRFPDGNASIARLIGRKERFLPLPDAAGGLLAALPGTPMGKDQWQLLKQGSVVSGEHPGFAELGIEPKPLNLFLDKWMVRYRRQGRFSDRALP